MRMTRSRAAARRTAAVLGGAAALGLSAAAALGAAPPPSAAEYVIGAGDVLQVFVWKEADLTRDLTVRLDGRVTLPLLGDVEAAGHTPADLARRIGEQLKRFVAAPVVSVAVSQAVSAQVFVIGQVARPGAVPLTGRLTVVQALAQAGGFREFAKSDRILVVRGGSEAAARTLPFNYKKVEDGSDLEQNVVLQPGDTIVVP